MILTHDEAKKLRDSTCMNDPLALIHATELEVIAKLSAGVSVEPYDFSSADQDWVHTNTTLNTAIAAARCKAIEECEGSWRLVSAVP